MSKRRPYVRPMDGWWKKHPFYIEYMIHEWTAFFVAASTPWRSGRKLFVRRSLNQLQRRQHVPSAGCGDGKARQTPKEKVVLLADFSNGKRVRAVVRSGHGQASRYGVITIMPQGLVSHSS